MNLKPTLLSIGLTSKEADIYIACLEHGPLNVSDLSKRSGYKRTTLYDFLQEMLRKDYLILLRRNKKTLYDAERPKKLLAILRSHEKKLEQSLPELDALRNKRAEIPYVTVFEGDDAVLKTYQEIYENFSETQETCFLTAIGDLTKNFPNILDLFLKKLDEPAPYKIRELIFDDAAGRHYVKNEPTKKKNHEVRLLPAKFPLHNDIILSEHRVIVCSYENRSVATVFENPGIAKSLKALYEWAWMHGSVN